MSTSINYELALALKNAGFPQKKESDMYTNLELSDRNLAYPESVYYPTLSELIEACGEDFDALFGPYSSINNHEGQRIREWRCDATNRTGYSVVGSTHEESVAKLWLSLNNKEL